MSPSARRWYVQDKVDVRGGQELYHRTVNPVRIRLLTLIYAAFRAVDLNKVTHNRRSYGCFAAPPK